MTFAVNVLAPFVITSLLLPDLVYAGLLTSNTPILPTTGRSNDDINSHSGCSTTNKDTLMNPTSSRIVIASSISQSWSPIDNWDDIHLYQNQATTRYSAHRSYSQSKLLDAMLTMELSDRLQQLQHDYNVQVANAGGGNTQQNNVHNFISCNSLVVLHLWISC